MVVLVKGLETAQYLAQRGRLSSHLVAKLLRDFTCDLRAIAKHQQQNRSCLSIEALKASRSLNYLDVKRFSYSKSD